MASTLMRLAAVAAVCLTFVGASAAANCEAVTDLDTLKSKKLADKNLRIGPGGFFADVSDDSCYVLSIDEPGFKEQNPTLAAAYADIIGNTAVSKRLDTQLEARAKPGCGQVCDPKDGCLAPCACRFMYETCTPYGDCYDIYRCKG
ncbi:hypothetical protein BC629DRAFT_1437656 [Irpex lacteus]|nr:hypothetical protein BC629DRAFT_1437656 [Irpex lacteus]